MELPLLSHAVIYEEKVMIDIPPHMPPQNPQDCLSCATLDETKSPPTLEFDMIPQLFNPAQLSFVSDWDSELQNLTEDQNRKLNYRT